MAQWPATGNYASQVQHGGESWHGFGENSTSAITGMESEVHNAFTAQDLRAYISVHSGANVAVALLIDASAGNQSLTVTGTGEFKDTTNTDSLSDGNDLTIHFDQTAGMHGDGYAPRLWQLSLENASSDVPELFGAFQGSYSALAGTHGGSTESEIEYTFKRSATLSDLTVYCSSHTSTGTLVVRKNRADGNNSISITGTGIFRDTTNTDTFSSGDEGNLARSSGTWAISVRSIETNISAAIIPFHGAAFGSSTLFLMPNGQAFSSSTEAEAQVEADDSATIQNLQVNCYTHAETRTIRTRVSGSNGNASVSVTGTGVFEDTTNTDSLSDGSLLAIQQDSGTSGNNSYIVYVEWETSAGTSVALAGNKPASSGVVIESIFAAGNKPAHGPGVLALQANIAVTGNKPAHGPGEPVEAIFVAGSKPAANGNVIEAPVINGNKPAHGAGVLAFTANIAVAGSKPAHGPGVVIESIFAAGNKPAHGPGVLVATPTINLAGNKPAHGAGVVIESIFIAGNKPAHGPGVLLFTAQIAVAGNKPAATGEVIEAIFVAGNKPAASGEVIEALFIAGNKPAHGPGVLVTLAQIALAGNKPTATGEVIEAPLLSGSKPAHGPGVLALTATIAIVGAKPAHGPGVIVPGIFVDGNKPAHGPGVLNVTSAVAVVGNKPAHGPGVVATETTAAASDDENRWLTIFG